MPAAKLTPLDREHVAATYAATAGDAAETARRHNLDRKHVNQLVVRYPELFAASRPTALVVTPPARRAVTMSPVTAAQAITESYAEHGTRGRIASAKASAKALEHLEHQAPAKIVKQARALKDLTSASGSAGGWESNRDIGLQVNILSVGGSVTTGI